MKRILITLLSSLSVVYCADISTLASEVFTGGNSYSEEAAIKLSQEEDYRKHQRTIVAIQMMASVDDVNRYSKAIEMADQYLIEGDEEWALKYVNTQKAFLLGLKGDSEQSANLMESILNQTSSLRFDAGGDWLYEVLNKSHPNFGEKVHDLFRQSLSSYYILNFPKDDLGAHVKSYKHIQAMKMEGLKERCLKQLLIQTNRNIDDFPTVQKNEIPSLKSALKKKTIAKERKEKSLPDPEEVEKLRAQGEPITEQESSSKADKPASFPWWLLGIVGLIVVLGFLLLKGRSK